MNAIPEGEWFCPDCTEDPGAPIVVGSGKKPPAAKKTVKRPAPDPEPEEDEEEEEEEEEEENGAGRKRKAASGGRKAARKYLFMWPPFSSDACDI